MDERDVKIAELQRALEEAQRELKAITQKFQRHVDRGLPVRQEQLKRIAQLELDISTRDAQIALLKARNTALQHTKGVKLSKRKIEARKKELRTLKRDDENRRP